jgi:hypothetical protein
MALSNWDMLAFDSNGPSHFGSVANHDGVTVALYKNWLQITRRVSSTTGPRWRRTEQVSERHEATVHSGELRIGSWSIHARRGPQNGIYVIAESSRWDQQAPGDHQVDKKLLVGCGVYGYTNPAESYECAAVDLGVDPATLMTSTVLDERNEQRAVVGFRGDAAGFEMVTIARDVPDAEWVGVLPESVGYLKAFVQDYLRGDCGADGWLGSALAQIPWDQAERCNQGDLFFEDAVGFVQAGTAPGHAADPLLIQTLGRRPDG